MMPPTDPGELVEGLLGLIVVALLVGGAVTLLSELVAKVMP